MKRYYMLLLYNDKIRRREWLSQKQSECISWEWKNKSNELILRYDYDIFTSPDNSGGCEMVWKVCEYNRNINTGKYPEHITECFSWRFAGSQFYYVEYLDGLFDARDIMYLMCRTRGGVEEMIIYNKCPRCKGDISCLGGRSAHWSNWYCDDPKCGWEAWKKYD